MTIQSLFKQRSSIHFKQLSRYMKYVLNDHFVLALLLVLGAAGFGYSNYVQTIEQGAILPRFILLILMVGVVASGTITTLMQQADIVFLLPLESEVIPVLKKSVWKSLLVLAFPVAFVSAAAMPLLVVTQGINFNIWPLFLVTSVLFKYIDLNFQFMSFFQSDVLKKGLYTHAGKMISLFGFTLSIFVGLSFGLFFSLIIVLIQFIYSKKMDRNSNRLQWNDVIEKEENRQQKLFRFINLFTEVSFVESHPRRLRWLDKVIDFQSGKSPQPHYFYILRSFYRNPSYSGLVSRLVLIGILLISFSTMIVLNLMLAVLFLYLIGFQLMPIYQQFKQNFYFQLYPIQETGKIISIQRLITEVLAVVLVIFTLTGLAKDIYSGASLFLGGGVFILMFTRLYLPKRLKRMEQF
ncbi:ABC transporter permease [Marinilactibacillus sp. Marseille-P9653]|uniref:ABC transporter permease n=1 Tax=Marinilactibacillus sp. Marseille-P9653 TaxID=2866583 RepID=UPI001CE3B904|nr:ABC transporter permease [Marinilactibacillus sp. Marseille-P9653]